MRDRSAVQRTGTTAPAYAVDLTLDSDSDAEVVPLGSSNRHNKRKRVSRKLYERLSHTSPQPQMKPDLRAMAVPQS